MSNVENRLHIIMFVRTWMHTTRFCLSYPPSPCSLIAFFMPVSRCHDYLPTYLFLPRAEIAFSEKGTHRTRIQRTSVTVTLMGIGKSVTVADCHCIQ